MLESLSEIDHHILCRVQPISCKHTSKRRTDHVKTRVSCLNKEQDEACTLSRKTGVNKNTKEDVQRCYNKSQCQHEAKRPVGEESRQLSKRP